MTGPELAAGPDVLVIEGGLLLSPRASALLAKVVHSYVAATERTDGAASSSLLVLLAQLNRGARLASPDAHARTSVAYGLDETRSSHGIDVLDTAAAAELLGCSCANVRDLARRGSLHGRRVAGRWVFDRADVGLLLMTRAA